MTKRSAGGKLGGSAGPQKGGGAGTGGAPSGRRSPFFGALGGMALLVVLLGALFVSLLGGPMVAMRTTPQHGYITLTFILSQETFEEASAVEVSGTPIPAGTPAAELPILLTQPPSTTPAFTMLPAPPTLPLFLRLDQGYHCRGGAGTSYPVLRDFTAGTELELIGRSADNAWYLIRIHDSATRKKLCWINGGEVQGNPIYLPVCTWSGDGYTDDAKCDN
jgi:hypothetical protein